VLAACSLLTPGVNKELAANTRGLFRRWWRKPRGGNTRSKIAVSAACFRHQFQPNWLGSFAARQLWLKRRRKSGGNGDTAAMSVTRRRMLPQASRLFFLSPQVKGRSIAGWTFNLWLKAAAAGVAAYAAC